MNADAVREDIAYFSVSKATLRTSSSNESDLGELLSHTLSYTSLVGRLCTGDRCISPVKAAVLVNSLIRNWVDSSATWRGKIRLVCRGAEPALVRMEVRLSSQSVAGRGVVDRKFPTEEITCAKNFNFAVKFFPKCGFRLQSLHF